MKLTGLSKFSSRTLLAAFIGTLGVIATSRESAVANDIAFSEAVRDTDYVAAGVGGMRNSTTASINLTGVSGTVNKAYLYWHGPSNVENPLANANIRFAGRNITGVSLGLSDDNCWGFLNSAAYRADVTPIVKAERNGTYTLSQFLKQGTNINANGASLLVFFHDTNPDNNRDIVLFEGNDSNAPNPHDELGWNISLPDIRYMPTNFNTSNVLVQLHISDGQTWEDDAVVVNDLIIQARGAGFQGSTVPSNNNGPENNGSLWDIKTWDLTPLFNLGTNALRLIHNYIGRGDGTPRGDCVSLVVAVVNLPVGSAPPEPPPPPANLAPVITGNPVITVYTPEPLTVTALATDANGDPLTYTIAINGTPVQTGDIPAGTPTTSGTLSVTNAFSLGQHTVVFSAYDGQLWGTFTTVVNVIDTNPPVLNLPPNITVPTDPGKTNAVVTYVVTATDDFPGVTVISLPPSGNMFPIGTTTVTATAVDTSGNRTQGTFTITVTDSLPPYIFCPADIIRATDPGTNNAVVHYTIPASDNMPGLTLACTPVSGSVFPIGITAVNCTARDAAGNTSTCMFTVTIMDTEPPVITIPTNMIVIAATGQCSSVVDYVVTVSDNAPGATVACLPPSGSIFSLGVTPVVCTAMDAALNKSTNSFTVTVLDKEKPALNLPADIIVPTDPGKITGTVNFTVTATDNCSVPTVSTRPDPGSFPIGTTVVTSTATDSSGNTQTGTFTVTVVDTEPPVITTPTNMILVADIGQCSAVVNYTVTVRDNIPGATVICTPPSGSVFPKGTTTVVCIATDVAGNRTTNSFLVTIVDTQKPVLNLPANISVVIPPAQTSTVVSFTVTATDNCSIPTVVSTPLSGSSFPVGVTVVTNVATDADGNTTTGTFTVTVRNDTTGDTVPPVITVPTNMVVGTDINQCSAVVNYTVTVTDNVPGATVVCNPPSGSAFPKGVATVNCVATDVAGNQSSASFTVTVVDTQKPVLNLPANISVVIPPGQSNAVVTFTVTATDNCSVPTVISTPPSGSTFPVGVTVITNVATDVDGNTTTGTFTVTIVARPNEVGDTVPPVITVPTNMIVATDLNLCSAVVNYTVTVTDNLPGATVVCNPPSGSTFPKGVTPVLCVATDVAGNQSSASFTVTVVDTQKPVLNLPANISVVIPPAQTSTVVSFNVTSTDNCSIPTVVSTPPSGSSFPVGVTIVTNVATDAEGNTTAGTFTVTVRNDTTGDLVPPVITVPTNMVVGTDINQCSAVVNYTVTVTDNVPGATVVCNPPSGSTFPKGVTTVLCVATDVAGNQASASFTVTVVDTQKPVLNLPTPITVTIASNETSAVVNYNVTATDNCSVPTVISTPHSGSSFPIGVTTVTNITTDGAGNTTTDTFTVTVRQDTGGDNEPPVIVSVTPSKTCLWPPNHKMVPITVTVKATDNSGKKVTARIVSVTSNEPENDLGDGNTERDWNITGTFKVNLRAERSGLLTDRLYTITVEVTDAAGNISYGTTTVCVSHDQSNKKNTAATRRR